MDEAERIIRLEQNAEHFNKELDDLYEEIKELKKENKAIYDIAASVKILTEKIGNIENKVDETAESLRRTEDKITKVKEEPSEKIASNLEKIRLSVMTAIATGAAVAIVMKILEITF